MSDERLQPQPARTLAGATVLQVVPALKDDAVGRGALDIAAGLLRSGARALVAGGGGRLVGELQSLGGEWTELDLGGGTLRRRRRAQQILPLLHSERVGLVHAQGPEAARMGVSLVKSARVPLLTTYHGMPPAPAWLRPPEDAQARGDLVGVVSEFAALAVAERHRIPADRTVVIPSAVETGWYDPDAMDPARVIALRESWHVRPEARIVLLPGSMSASQGHLTLIDAARSLINGGLRGVVFVIAGNEPEDAEYRRLVNARIEAQGLRPVFRDVGHCPDMRAAYAAADFVVLPFEREDPFSAIAVEAQAMARPVIASNLGAMPEMLQAPPLGAPAVRTGWLIPPYDALALARSLAAAFAMSPREFDVVADHARQWAVRMFSPERVAAATLATYLSLLREH